MSPCIFWNCLFSLSASPRSWRLRIFKEMSRLVSPAPRRSPPLVCGHFSLNGSSLSGRTSLWCKDIFCAKGKYLHRAQQRGSCLGCFALTDDHEGAICCSIIPKFTFTFKHFNTPITTVWFFHTGVFLWYFFLLLFYWHLLWIPRWGHRPVAQTGEEELGPNVVHKSDIKGSGKG